MVSVPDFPYLTIADAAALIARRALSPVELIDAHLERVVDLDPVLHAFITLTGQDARRAARAAEAEILAGTYRGPLHGIPIAHKDIIWTKGVRTTAHSNALRNWVPEENATVVDRLEAAGAISLGKTALHEFAFGSPGEDEAFPAARNPWNPNHMPGSSSTGSGAAVAAGLVMGATGTDTGGSVRHPSAVCATVGMKPTFGRVSCHGVIPLAPSMDHVGPMTRTVTDNAIMLQAMAGYDARDPHALADAVPDFAALIGKNIRGMRLGVPRKFMASIAHTDDILAAFEKTLTILRELGATLEEIEPDGLEDSHDAGSLVIVYEAYRYHRKSLDTEPEKFAANLRARFAKAHLITDEQYQAALQKMRRLKASVSALLENGLAGIVNPARERPAQTMAELVADPLGKRSLALRMYSVTGNPALVQPMGFNAEGLPLGLQIAAAHGREDIVYQIAHAYEQAAGWHRHHPQLSGQRANMLRAMS